MSEIVIDSKEFRECFKNLEVYRSAVAMTAIFRHKGNCLMYCQDYSQMLSKKLRASVSSIESFLSKKKLIQNCYSPRHSLEIASVHA